MKARIKATGEIVEVDQCSVLYDDGRRELMYGKELEEVQGAPDYWTRLEHQAAIGAMQAYIIASHISQFSFCECDKDMKDCKSMAHALVEKLKEKEERK